MQTALAIEYEEQRGKPMPSKNHGIVQSNLIMALGRFRDEFTIVSELSLELAERPLVPDISVFPKLPIDWHNDEATLSDPPSLVIEILSPTQAVDDLVKKADVYFAAGVRSCWIVQPSLKMIANLVPNEEPTFHAKDTVVDRATGIEILIEDVFR